MTIFIPLLVSIVMPADPSLSLMVIVPQSVLRTFVSGVPSEAGDSSSLQKQPLHIGQSRSPCSNSIQTEAFTGGIRNQPTFLPAYGTQGMAQRLSLTPSTSGAVIFKRPRFRGSLLSETVPRYLPKYFWGPLIFLSGVIDQRVSAQRKALLVLPAFNAVRNAPDVIKSIVGFSGAANRYQCARLQQPA